MIEFLRCTVGNLLDEQARKHPDGDALIYSDRDLKLSCRDLNSRVDRLAKGMHALGIRKRDHIFFTDSFPLTASGKVQKFKLREDTAARLQKSMQQAAGSNCRLPTAHRLLLTAHYFIIWGSSDMPCS